jgi:serine palmitoyltransferase
MGPQGRGIANNFHVKTSDIDILMDTFTTSFGASGGYIAYYKEVISARRIRASAYPRPS